MDLVGTQSISQLVSQMFTIDGVKCEKALVSELFKNVCEDEHSPDSGQQEQFKVELRKLIECYFS